MTGSDLVPSDGSPSTGTETDSNLAPKLQLLKDLNEQRKANNKTTLIGLAILAGISLVVALANTLFATQGHQEKMACIDLRKTQPTADCGDGGYKPTFPNQQQPAAMPTQPKEPPNMEVVNLTHGGFWERATGPSFKVCTGSGAMNMCPTITKLEGGEVSPQTCPDGKRAILLPAGSCAIATPKGATS